MLTEHLAQSSLAVRATFAAAGVTALLGALGYPLAWCTARGALLSYRLLLAPLLGWAVLSAGGYILLAPLTFGPAFTCLIVVAGTLDLAILARTLRRRAASTVSLPHTGTGGGGGAMQQRRGASTGSLLHTAEVVGVLLLSLAVFLIALAPQLHHRTLTLLVPNQDDEFFVEVVNQFWNTPTGWRLALGMNRLETGWAYHLMLCLFRLVPGLDPFEAVPAAGYLALALSVAPTYVLFRRTFRLPGRWALAGAGLAPLHGLVLWVPGYGFGPNAAAIAATPLAMLAATRALRLQDRRSLALGAVALAFLLMAYTKVSVLLALALGAGLAVASLTTRRQRAWPQLTRLATMYALGAGLAAYALWDAAAWGLARAGSLLFDAGETTGAGWGWRDFPSLATWAGVGSWSLIATPWPTSLNRVALAVTLAGGLAAAALAACGLCHLCRRPYRPVLGLVFGCILCYVYARYLKAFPYAVFKFNSLDAVVFVGLCVRGALYAARGYARLDRPAGGRPARRPIWAAAVACAALISLASFGLTTWQSLRFYWQPWEPLVRPADSAEVAALAAAVPPGSTAFISGSFVTPVIGAQAAVRNHPIGFHTLWDAEQFGAARLRTLLAKALAARGATPAGVFTRAAGYTVEPPGPYEYVVLGAGEDPAFFDVAEDVRVARGHLLDLYRARTRGALGVSDLASLMDEADAGRPVFLAATCAGDLQAAESGLSAPLVTCGRADLTIGLLPSAPGPVTLSIGAGREERVQTLYLEPGTSWYTAAGIALPARIAIRSAPGAAVYVDGGWIAPPAGGRDALRQSSGAATLLGLSLQQGTVTLDVRSAGADLPRGLSVALAFGPIGPGPAISTDADLSKPFQRWQWRLAPGAVIEQRIDGGAVPLAYAPKWPVADGAQWLRLQFRRGDQVWREVPVGYVDIRSGQAVAVHQFTAHANIPAPEPAIVPPLPKAGTLVKGRRDDVFLVDERGLRWISSLDVFMRHGFSWPSVQQVDDLALAHWPVDLPLDDAPD